MSAQPVTEPHPDSKSLSEESTHSAEPKHEKEEDEEGNLLDYACGFFHWPVIRNMLILGLVGISSGAAGGMTGPLLVLQGYTEDCSLYTSPGSCSAVMNQDCIWKDDTSTCEWRVGMCNTLGSDSNTCKDVGMMKCHYNYDDEKCVNTTGFSSLYSGFYGCVPMVMQIILGLFAGDILAFLHHRFAFITAGFLLTFGSVMQHVGMATNEFWVSLFGRFCLGFGYVFITVPGLVYVNQNAPPRYKQALVSFYCVVNNFGQFLPAAIGAALGLTVDFGGTSDSLALHCQLYCAYSTLLGVGMLLMGYFVTESPYWAGEADEKLDEPNEQVELKDVDDEELLQKVDEMEKAKGIDVSSYSWFSMLPRLLVGMVVAMVVQLTGISAFGNYAPIITERIGIEGLKGGMLIQAWNTISASMCLVILGITTNLRLVVLAGAAIAGAACVITGIFIFPGVIDDETLRNGISIAAIAMYILAFQSCIAGAFYPLTQEMYPLSFRPRGSSFMTMCMMLFAFSIAVCFPVALTGLSGGPSGNQNQGMSICMLFFGAVSFVGFTVMFFFLRPWTAKDEKEFREKKSK